MPGAAAGSAVSGWWVTQDLVGTLLYLASPASDFLTGQTLVVNGGAYLP
jgi:NAD(P)-dependent dehydrogenase (short-subunit alcohol dehydrogenase family)